MKKKIAFIIITLFIMIESNVLAQNTIPGLVSSGQTIEEKYPDGRIEILGVQVKDPLVLGQMFIAIFLAIAFLQSGIDKILDRKGNVDYFKNQFANSPLNKVSSFALSLITIMELAAGGLLAYGVVYAITERTTMMIFNGFLITSFTLLALFFGQRIAKDYDGAATIVLYFILTMLGIMSMY